MGDWKIAKQYTLTSNVTCPHCKTRIIADKKLNVIPTSEGMETMMLAHSLAEELDKIGVVVSDKCGNKHDWTDQYVVDHLASALNKVLPVNREGVVKWLH
jgi:endonuclease I